MSRAYELVKESDSAIFDGMMSSDNVREDFRLARCCNPEPGDVISGFLKREGGLISVHKSSCPHLSKIQPQRLISLIWGEILTVQSAKSPYQDPDYQKLDETDFVILKHHAEMGVDYAAVVAKQTKIDKAVVFERHRKLRDLRLLARVQPKMIQYRKDIVNNKWIKHRNHTYYELTDKGREYLKIELGKRI